MSRNELPPLETEELGTREFKKINRRRLLTWSVLSIAGLFGLNKIANSELDREMPWPLRKAMDGMDGFWKANFSEKSAVQKTAATTDAPRLNGNIGMEESIGLDWRLQITAPDLEKDLFFSLEDLKKMPAVTESFDFKCIEGWSRPVTCTGIRFSDLIEAQGDNFPSYGYAALTSVNEEYYVSMDEKSLYHHQTLLCYAMNGQDLKIENGYPLRLITPVKYGVKNIKQIGRIAFTDSPPADYWAERGYGDFVGL